MKDLLISQPLVFALSILVFAGLLSGIVIVALLPHLRRNALAHPNHRSSHHIPTPQGGGLAVIAAVIVTGAIALNLFGVRSNSELIALGIAAVLLAGIGFYDDLHPIGVTIRLVLQGISVLIAVLFLPDDLRVCPAIDLVLERSLTAIALLWFVNVVNFMDGLDWLTVIEIVPVTLALILVGTIQVSLPWETTVVSAALCGALLGFAPFNKPVARLFLGDAGSLPIGLLLGWCLLHLAAEGHFAAALLLPMFYLADTTITLIRRTFDGKSFWQSHREHFYQRATDNRFAISTVLRDVACLNLFLGALALASIEYTTTVASLVFLVCGGCAVGLVLWRFSRPASV